MYVCMTPLSFYPPGYWGLGSIWLCALLPLLLLLSFAGGGFCGWLVCVLGGANNTNIVRFNIRAAFLILSFYSHIYIYIYRNLSQMGARYFEYDCTYVLGGYPI